MKFVWMIYWYIFGQRLLKQWQNFVVVNGDSKVDSNRIIFLADRGDGFSLRLMVVSMNHTVISILYVLDGNEVVLQADLVYGAANYGWEVTEITYGGWMWKLRK